MSTESQKMEHGTGDAPRHADVSYESRDVKVGSIYGYLVILGVTTIIALIVCVYILRFTTHLVASSEPSPPESREALGKDYSVLPPEPRLQGVPGHVTDPQQDLRDKVKADSQANEKLGWIDQPDGIAQIPVKDAMKIVAEKGLVAVAAPSAEKK